MNLILFLGSGVSMASGHPNALDLTRNILGSKEHHTETQFLKALEAYDIKARGIGSTTYVSSDKIVGENYRDTSSYEDLYYLCDEIALFDWGMHNNAMVPAFMLSLVEEFSPFLNGDSTIKKLREIGKLAHAAKNYINKAVIENLTTPENITGLDLILEFANHPEVAALNIITLNHDLLVEDLLIRNGLQFEDGFGPYDGDIRWFEPNTYLTNCKIKILKLHGSIDWYPLAIDGDERIGKIEVNSTNVKNASGKTVEITRKLPNVLSGGNKIKYYNSGMYTDIHYHFQRILYQNNLMVMSGYGWGDDPINNRLMTWLDKKRENRLILLDEKPHLLMERSMVFDRDRSNWEKLHKLKILDKWLSGTRFEDILKANSEMVSNRIFSP